MANYDIAKPDAYSLLDAKNATFRSFTLISENQVIAEAGSNKEKIYMVISFNNSDSKVNWIAKQFDRGRVTTEKIRLH